MGIRSHETINARIKLSLRRSGKCVDDNSAAHWRQKSRYRGLPFSTSEHAGRLVNSVQAFPLSTVLQEMGGWGVDRNGPSLCSRRQTI